MRSFGGGFLVASLFAVCAACSAGSSLTVQLTSDLVPGVDVERVELDVTQAGVSVTSGSRSLLGAASLGRPLRLASLAALPPGAYEVHVSLDRLGASVAERHVRVQVSGETYATILVTRSCEGVVCPPGSESEGGCLGHRCVPLGCTEEHPELCASPECTSDADCTASALSCVRTVCTATGTCFDQPDDTRCAATETCSTLVGCTAPATAIELDLAAGLRANAATGVASGAPATQHGVEGWWYRYAPGGWFGAVGALSPGQMDPSSFATMEDAREDAWRGWYAQSGLQIGQRGLVTFDSWSAPTWLGSTDGDTLQILPENSVSPIVEWRAPVGGHADVQLELRPVTSGGSDAELHVFAHRASGDVELQYLYASPGGAPDDYGNPTVAVDASTGRMLAASTDLAAGDSLFFLVRVGDNDAGDALAVRGAIRFTPIP